MNALELDLPSETRRCLRAMAEVGLLGSTSEDVAAYLILRGIDDMMRAGVLSFQDSKAGPQ